MTESTKPGRIPCINPNCRRTAPADKYEPRTEIICGKCFRALPGDLRNEHRRCWREINKWRRRITKTSDELKIRRMGDIVDHWRFRLNRNWQRICDALAQPDKPEGLENFLEEMNLR